MREEVPSLSYGFEDCALRALYLLGNRKNSVELVRRDYHYPVFVADHEVSPHGHGASDGRRLDRSACDLGRSGLGRRASREDR